MSLRGMRVLTFFTVRGGPEYNLYNMRSRKPDHIRKGGIEWDESGLYFVDKVEDIDSGSVEAFASEAVLRK